jgi:hypothetical protein
MGIQLQGQDLTQEQLDAIVPVLNDRMRGRVTHRKFESACLEAMDKAGCPFGDEEDDEE